MQALATGRTLPPAGGSKSRAEEHSEDRVTEPLSGLSLGKVYEQTAGLAGPMGAIALSCPTQAL